MIARRDAIALGAAALFAVAMPLLLLRPGVMPAPAPVGGRADPPLNPGDTPPLVTAFARPLFGAAPDAPIGETEPGDAPELIGIVGRLDRDAVALVRASDGSSRTLKVGESVDGWKLETLAIDAAFFTRGGQRVRVELPKE